MHNDLFTSLIDYTIIGGYVNVNIKMYNISNLLGYKIVHFKFDFLYILIVSLIGYYENEIKNLYIVRFICKNEMVQEII